MSKDFRNQLDDMIALFKRIRAQAESFLPEVDKSFYHSIDYLIDNYDTIRSQLSDDMLQHVGTPLQDALNNMVSQLRHELDQYEQTLNKMAGGEGRRLAEEISEIDELLRDKSLDEGYINELLDERARLMAKLESNSSQPIGNPE